MVTRTDADDGGSLATLGLLALTFAAGYALGTRSARGDRNGDHLEEPTEIAIDDGDGEASGQ